MKILNDRLYRLQLKKSADALSGVKMPDDDFKVSGIEVLGF